MSQLHPTTDKLFQLYQRHKAVTLGEGPDAVKVAMWKPTDDEARQGQMYMLERIGYWETEDTKVAERVESFMSNLPDDKHFVIGQILEQTIAQKISENMDLLDPVAARDLERGLLMDLTTKDFTDLWGIKLGTEAAFEAVRRTKGKDVARVDLHPFLTRQDEFDQWMDSELAKAVEKVFRAQETEIYMKEDIKVLKVALGTVNKRTVAMGLAVQDWTRRMCAVMTRELNVVEEGKSVAKGALLFSHNPNSPNFIGNAAQEIIELLSTEMNSLLRMGRAQAIREVADNGNFTSPVGLPSGSISPLPAVVVPPISTITPST